MKLTHTFAPVGDNESQILILGTFPSVKSRAEGFYYGNLQNRFWRILAAVFDEAVPQTTTDKESLLLRNKVALWDVAAMCDIDGSSDASIKSVVPNDINGLLTGSRISKIYANGRTAEKLYLKHVRPVTEMDIIALPSTSAANASMSFEKLSALWKVIRQ